MAIKLAAKFARQESEEARVARVLRKRIPRDRLEAVSRMLSLPAPTAREAQRRPAGDREARIVCPDCDRPFRLPMHLGRHRKAKHDPKPVGHDSA